MKGFSDKLFMRYYVTLTLGWIVGIIFDIDWVCTLNMGGLYGMAIGHYLVHLELREKAERRMKGDQA